MSNRRLMILGMAAAVMVVWAVGQSYISNVRVPERKALGGSYLIQGLEIGDVASIVLGKGDNAVRLVRRGNHFVVGNKDNYPALTSKINELITSCLDIRTVELITSDPANHESLDVTEAKAQQVIKFLDNGGQIITGVVVGSSRLPELQMDKRSTYVRLVTSDDVYEAKSVPLLGGSALDYVEKELVDVGRSDVTRVTITGPEGGYTLRVDDSNDENIILENIPEGRRPKLNECGQVLGALSYLSFDDVKKGSSLEDGDLNFDRTYVSELKDSTVYTFEIAKASGKTYVRCSAEYTGDVRKILASGDELEDKEAKLVARDRASSFAKKHKGWVYEISEWKSKQLTRKMAELVEEEEGEKKEGDEEDVPAGPVEDKQEADSEAAE
ncbi:MAG: DUF4340 domain-containing protein [Planctomycetota bacterium]|jgi:hypothetical protein